MGLDQQSGEGMSEKTAGPPMAAPEILDVQDLTEAAPLRTSLGVSDFLHAPRLQAQVALLGHELSAALVRADLAIKSSGGAYELAIKLREREEQLGLLSSLIVEILPALAEQHTEKACRLREMARQLIADLPSLDESFNELESRSALRLFMMSGEQDLGQASSPSLRLAI